MLPKKQSPNKEKLLVGWREWASLPELGIAAIKVKVDTGAKTSALHAFNIETFKKKGKEYARFDIHPIQKNDSSSLSCIAPVIDERLVKSSNGQKERRITINTPIRIGEKYWDIEVTLTNRDIMSYRMLLGREAMRFLIVEPAKSFCQGKLLEKEIIGFYQNGHSA